jgi:hypothetical protein
MTEKEQKFSLDDAVSAAWAAMLANFWPYLGLLSLASFLSVLPVLAGAVCNTNPDWWALTFVFSLLGTIVHVIAGLLGMICVQIRIVRGQSVNSDNLWGAARSFFPYIAATIFYLWVVAFGLCFLIVPGIIFSIMFRFYPYFMVEHKLGPIGALKASAAITSGAMWELLFLNLILGILKMFAPLAFFVGIVPAHMFSELALAEAYKILLDKTPPEQLPFPYAGSFASDDTLGWEPRMGYDAPDDTSSSALPSSQIAPPAISSTSDSKLDATIELSEEREAVQEVPHAVDNETGENDKTSQEH